MSTRATDRGMCAHIGFAHSDPRQFIFFEKQAGYFPKRLSAVADPVFLFWRELGHGHAQAGQIKDRVVSESALSAGGGENAARTPA